MINELRSMTTFVRTVELGSLSKAADAQQISPQAASKALKQLETHLGVRLFHRTTRNMSLTEEGQRFFEAAKPALMGLQQALATVELPLAADAIRKLKFVHKLRDELSRLEDSLMDL